MGPLFSLLCASCDFYFMLNIVKWAKCASWEGHAPLSGWWCGAESIQHAAELVVGSVAELESLIRFRSLGASRFVHLGLRLLQRLGIWAPARLFRSVCALQGQSPVFHTRDMLVLLAGGLPAFWASRVFSSLSVLCLGFRHLGAPLSSRGDCSQPLEGHYSVLGECPGNFLGTFFVFSALLPAFGIYFVC